jgi:uncharacterized protein YegL
MAADGKIQALNNAIREALPHMQAVADENPNAQILVRAIRFSSGASWHIETPAPVADFRWVDLQANGVTDLGKGLQLVTEQIHISRMSQRALPPVIVLLSDGQPTDDYLSGIQALLEQPWGKKAVRIAIAIGADADHNVLERFIANPEIPVLQADNPEALVRHIKWASTAVLQAASSPASQSSAAAGPGGNVPVPAPVPQGSQDNTQVVW